MRTIYSSLVARLKEKVPALRWIDFDFGQLEQASAGQNPPVAYPCALVSIAIPRCHDLTETIQTCEARITLRLAFNPLASGRTAANAPGDVREQALSPYDTIADVYAALQGFENGHFNALSRVSQEKESRNDIFIYRMVFRCEFEDETAKSEIYT
ncbi:MAG: hypothetical protein LBQ58_10630 [Synergistaceae bacterium]|jgi:hypothetical protein|nr:hypothetical protein [Synergistaceae bacterium]